MTDFSRILRQLLEERGVSQKWLAEAADTKEATISRYVNGINKSPNVEILISISRALNVSTDFLLGVSDVQQPKIDIAAEERILLSAFRKASDRDTKIIWELLDPYISPNEKGFLQQSKRISKIG